MRMGMVGINRCYICGNRFSRADIHDWCQSCRVEYHPECHERHETLECPRCVGEAWIDIFEF